MPPRTPPTQTTSGPIEHRFPAWGVDVFESHHADDWRMESTRHDFLKIVFVLHGAGALRRPDGTRVECRRGDVLVVPIGQEHRLEDARGKPMSLYVVSIQARVAEVAALDLRLVPDGRLDLGGDSSKVESSIRRLLFEQTLDQPVAGAKVISMTLRLLTELVRAGARAPRESSEPRLPQADRHADSITRMRTYVDDLEDHFFEATNLDNAAMGLGISRRRFTQLFRQVTGTSWLAYVRRLRVEHAKRLLAQTERTVLSIAFECGFEDLSTFYRAFKREVGQSPNQWRSAAQDSRIEAGENN
jgi:AraC-like DNA-binding protein